MSTIYSSLSNPSGDLKQLQQEFADLINFFNEPEIEPKTRFQFTLNGTIQDITAHLTEHQKEIRLFHFSGHSGQSGLDFEGEGFDVEHVSKFFNALSANKHLQCVFLNGCENAEIVKRLDKVPVVIGTKTKIQDTVARKVTLDFFKALIGGESTYEDAFTLALQASHIHDDGFTITRSEGSKLAADSDQPLNQYFIQFNDKEIANQQYAFSPKVKNWMKYLVLLLLLLTIGSGFIFKGEIKKLLFGYDCSQVSPKEGKCNFAVGDITSFNVDEPSQVLFNKISNAQAFIDNLNPMFIDSFQKMIRGASISRDSLPSRCQYDFNVTGNVETNGKKLGGVLRIFPSLDNKPVLNSIDYKLSFFDDEETIEAVYNDSTENILLVHGICDRCGMKPEFAMLRKNLASIANDFDPTHATATYQMLRMREAKAHLRYADSPSAIKAYDGAIKAVGNDFALYAIERKIDTYDSDKNFLRSIDTHTELIDQLEFRVQQPLQYKLSREVSAYKKGEDKIQYNRAMMILNHRNEVSDDYKQLAISDFTYLQKIKYPPGDFSKEIALLKGTLPPNPPPSTWEIDVRLQGKVVDENGRPIRAAEVQFAIDKGITDAQGNYSLRTYHLAELKGQDLLVSKPGYQYRRIPLTQTNFARIVLKPVPPTDTAMITIKGVVFSESGSPLPEATLTLLNKSAKTKSKGDYSFGEIPENQLNGQSIIVQRDGYEIKTIPVTKDSYKQITLTPVATEKYTIVVYGINVKQEKFNSVLTDLIKHNLPVDRNKSRNNEGAEYFGDRTLTVIYYKDSLKEQAMAVAKLMQLLTDRIFSVKSAKETTLTNVPKPQDLIVVNWFE